MIPLLDTHQHLIYREKVGYGWTTGIPALAAGDFTLSDYAGLTGDAGIGGTLFMETGVDDADYQAETRFVHGLSKGPGSGVVGIIASIRPESEDGFDAWLEESAALGVAGYRRILHVVDDAMSESEWQTMRARHPRGDAQIRALWQHARDFADSTDDMNLSAADLAEVIAPTLVVNGDRDPLYPGEISVSLFRGLPRASLFVIPGGGHGPIFEEFREAFARAALAFLRTA